MPVSAQTTYSLVSFHELKDWEKDDHAEALNVFLNTCRDMKRADWITLCKLAKATKTPKEFFEMFFQPVQIVSGNEPLFTGYFEPEIEGALTPDEVYKYPLYEEPEESRDINPWKTREEIMSTDLMHEMGLEIAYVKDPVDLHFLQIQGSGRIKLREGGTLRVGYGGANGHPYRSLGLELVKRGLFQSHEVNAEIIRKWVKENGEEGEALLYHNPSYTFFRKIQGLSSDKGPRGAMNRAITPLRSIAVDPNYIALGSPVWIEKAGDGPINQLMIAQDTGAAIKGAQRADIFFGTGQKAGKAAGRIWDSGRMIVLLPIQQAYAVLPEYLQ